MSTREVIDLAKRHGGVFSKQEAVGLGMPPATLTRRVNDGIFVRLKSGIFALPGTASRPDILLRAARRYMGAVVSHTSAARIHKMGPIPKSKPTVTVMHRGTYSFPGLEVHQSTDLRNEHTMRHNGLRVTTPERTAIDLARVLHPKRLERVLDNSLAGGIADFDRLVELFLALTRQGKTGMQALGDLLRERADDGIVDASVLERALFKLLRASGLPLPDREFHPPWLEPVKGRVDFAYLSKEVVVEADGRRWHGLFTAFEVDKRRDNAAQIHGWLVLRFTWKMIQDDPSYVIATIRSALESRT